MSVIEFPGADQQRASPKPLPPLPLPVAAERVRKLICLANEHLADGGRKNVAQARVVLNVAATEIDRGIATAEGEAVDELARQLMLALGPNFTVSQLVGVRVFLDILLAVMPRIEEARP